MNIVKKHYSWEEYYSLINNLAEQIRPKVESNEINQILALARGGNIIGDALSRIFNLPLAIMFTASYNKDHQQSSLIIGDSIAKQYNILNDKILIVDDLVDSGKTLETIKLHIENTTGNKAYSAAIWKKTTCEIFTDYYVTTMLPNEWIVQPFEIN